MKSNGNYGPHFPTQLEAMSWQTASLGRLQSSLLLGRFDALDDLAKFWLNHQIETFGKALEKERSCGLPPRRYSWRCPYLYLRSVRHLGL